MIFDANQELILRLGVFTTVLLVIFLWETLAPKKNTSPGQWIRRGNNLGLGLVNGLIIHFALPLAAVGTATIAQFQGWGLLNIIGTGDWTAILLSLVALDLVIYGQHRLFHKVPALWRYHRVHHSDETVDTTTAVRFHPIEIALSMLLKILVVLLLGVPPLAMLVFEITLNAGAMFNHGNIRIPVTLDRLLRWLIVTPDMHRIHHSVHEHESHCNYGFNLSCWDRLLATYKPSPIDGHRKMRVGVAEFSGKLTVNLGWLLLQPFVDNDHQIKS